jgi:ADP-ribose pyrophosphatase YjhB (NUDIX family)
MRRRATQEPDLVAACIGDLRENCECCFVPMGDLVVRCLRRIIAFSAGGMGILLLYILVILQADIGRAVLWKLQPPESISLYGLGSVANYSSASDLPHLGEVRAADLRPAGRTAPIGDVHSSGLLHRGIWLFVREQPTGRILMLRRSPSVVTCPGAWGLVGEHSLAAEPWRRTAQRALREELGLELPLARISLLGQPVLFKSDYARDGGLGARVRGTKRDLQVTATLLAELPPGPPPKFTFDEDVAESTWLSPSEVEQWALSDARDARAAGNESARYVCNDPIRALLRLALRRLREAPPPKIR